MSLLDTFAKIKTEMVSLRRFVYRGAYALAGGPNAERETVDRFHELFYDSALLGKTWNDTTWFGVSVLKCPFDLWLYQEILHEVKPDLVIETGTAAGGSAFYMASLFDLLNRGRVVTIDVVSRQGRPQHPRITYLTGSSIAPDIVAELRRHVSAAEKVLVVLDSDHSERHVSKEIELYKDFVSPGSYLIVEDSNINGHPVAPGSGPGPMEAIEKFLATNRDFVIDPRMEKYLFSFNPRGYLRRR